MLTAQFLFFLAISAALATSHQFPAPLGYLFPAVAAVSSRYRRMVDATFRNGGFPLEFL